MAFGVLFVIAIALAYFLDKYFSSFWSRRGIKQVSPSFLIGSAGPLLTAKCSMGQYLAELYNKHKQHKLLGIYMFYRPVLVIIDPKLVQDILVKDFSSFHDRPMSVDEKNDPLSSHLFNVPGQKWRDLRMKLTPTFTSGKLKGMFSIIKDCGNVLEDYLLKNVEKGDDVFEFRDLMARFNTNIISSVAFGIDNDCINEPNHIFRQMGAKFFEPNLRNGIRAFFVFFCKELFHKLGMKTVDDDVKEFIYSIVKQTVAHREKNNSERNDFMQLLIQLLDKSGDKEIPESKIDIDQLAANVFVFFIAGFETTSSTMSYCLMELARNLELQRKAQAEIDKVFKASGSGGITYDTMSDLKYLEFCIDETLRKYPVAPILFRESTKEYKIPESDLKIPKGTSIFIPLLGLHRDPNIYENPMDFKPERFAGSSNGGGKADGLFYLPFGDGPRNCIGLRIGKLSAKLGLAVILSKFSVELVDKEMAEKEVEFHPKQFMLTPLKLFNLKVSLREVETNRRE